METKTFFTASKTKNLALLIIVMLTSTHLWSADTPLTLPKTWESTDGKDAYTEALGCTKSGLGSDYSSSPKLKFDTQGDYLIIQLADAPDKLGYSIKGNPGSGTTTSGTFDVLESSDGSNYTSVKSHTNQNNTVATISNQQLSSSTRYIKFIYTTKTSGNISLGGISISKFTPSCSTSVTLSNSGQINGSVNLTQEKGSETNISSISTASATKVYLHPVANTGYGLSGTPTAKLDGTAQTVNDEGDGWYSVSLDACATGTLTVSATFVQPYTITWQVEGSELTGASLGSATTSVYSGNKVTTLPNPPTSTCEGTFVGWVKDDETVAGKTVSDNYTTAPSAFTTPEGSPTITANTTFVAIFKKEKED